jgi:mannose-6-phosphate isomerase-like protein (cupin superfamily)
MTIIINQTELPSNDIGWEFEGFHYGDPNASFLIIEAQPGTGPRLHSHPYPEIFIIQTGQATFTIGDSTLHATGGQIIVAPANVPHKFINTGTDTLRQIDIHPTPHFITTWLED